MRRTISFVILLILVVAGFLLVKGRYGVENCGLEPQTACQEIQEVLDYNNPSSLKVQNHKGAAITENPQRTVHGSRLQSGSTFAVPVNGPITVVTE